MTRFNAQGEPCITPETSRNLGLAYEFNQGCLDYQTLYPAAQLTADPYKNQISITVPTSALTPESILLRKDIIQEAHRGCLIIICSRQPQFSPESTKLINWDYLNQD